MELGKNRHANKKYCERGKGATPYCLNTCNRLPCTTYSITVNNTRSLVQVYQGKQVGVRAPRDLFVVVVFCGWFLLVLDFSLTSEYLCMLLYREK